jgi:hypothetical protein
MSRSSAIHCATLLFTLGLALPLAAEDTDTNGDRSQGNRNDAAQVFQTASRKKSASSEANQESDVQFTLVCGHGSCGSRGGYSGGYASGYGGYGGGNGNGYSRGYGGNGYSMPVMPMRVSQPVGYSATPVMTAPIVTAPAAAAPAPSIPNAVIVLANPQDDPVSYTLNGARYDMSPRYSQKLTSKPSWLLEFDRGGSFGTARYTLTQGTYKFVATERGWDVVKDAGNAATPSAGHDYANYAGAR